MSIRKENNPPVCRTLPPLEDVAAAQLYLAQIRAALNRDLRDMRCLRGQGEPVGTNVIAAAGPGSGVDSDCVPRAVIAVLGQLQAWCWLLIPWGHKQRGIGPEGGSNGLRGARDRETGVRAIVGVFFSPGGPPSVVTPQSSANVVVKRMRQARV